MKKRLLSLMLALVLFASAVTSCSETPPDDTAEKIQGPVSSESGESAADDETDVLEYFSQIESADYDGVTVTIPDRAFNPNNIWFAPVLLDDYYGDAFYDSIYDRQLAVEDKMNIEFEAIIGGWDDKGIANSIIADSGAYDLCFPMLSDIFSYVQQGLALDINTLNVNTSNPYWNQNSVEDLTFAGKLYYGFPDINFDQYESMGVLFYNAQLLDNVGYNSSLYDLWKEGKWSIDEMSKMMEVVIQDVSGDGQYRMGEDIYGLIGAKFSYLPPLYASGIKLYEYDLETETTTTFLGSEEVVKCGEALQDVYFRKSGVNLAASEESNRNAFKAGYALFYSRQIGEFKNLRDQEDDYGIINWPSMDGRVDGKVYVSVPYCMFVPADIRNPECISTVIELMASYTYDVVMDNYIERSVIGKGTRDQQSAEIVRELFKRRVFDLEEGLNIEVASSAWEKVIRLGTYASMAKALEKAFQRAFFRAVDSIVE